MISWLLSNIKDIGILTFGFFSLLVLGENSRLKKKNDELKSQASCSNKIIDIQQKVIDVTENTKPSDFDGNIKLMQDGKF